MDLPRPSHRDKLDVQELKHARRPERVSLKKMVMIVATHLLAFPGSSGSLRLEGVGGWAGLSGLVAGLQGYGISGSMNTGGLGCLHASPENQEEDMRRT